MRFLFLLFVLVGCSIENICKDVPDEILDPVSIKFNGKIVISSSPQDTSFWCNSFITIFDVKIDYQNFYAEVVSSRRIFLDGKISSNVEFLDNKIIVATRDNGKIFIIDEKIEREIGTTLKDIFFIRANSKIGVASYLENLIEIIDNENRKIITSSPIRDFLILPEYIIFSSRITNEIFISSIFSDSTTKITIEGGENGYFGLMKELGNKILLTISKEKIALIDKNFQNIITISVSLPEKLKEIKSIGLNTKKELIVFIGSTIKIGILEDNSIEEISEVNETGIIEPIYAGHYEYRTKVLFAVANQRKLDFRTIEIEKKY